jgi:signal transduction histidine kinase
MLMAVLGHDLRTPLGTVLASAEFLVRNAPDEQAATVAGRIRNSSLRMSRMVHQLLNLARLQGGRMQLQPRASELSTLCRGVIEEFSTHERASQITFTSRGNTSGNWDTDLLWQAISNLISNALHHGEQHSPIAVELDADESNWLKLSVANRGAIPPAMLPHLFEPFGPNAAGERHREGLGLGLHIVHKIVHMHGGKVTAKSDEIIGTVFTVELPRTAQSWVG